MNLVGAVVRDEAAVNGTLAVPISRSQRANLSGPSVTLGLRPTSFVVADEGGLRAQVEVVEDLGAEAFMHCTAELEDGPTNLVVRCDGRTLPRKGEVISLQVTGRDVHVFDGSTGQRVDL